MNTGNIASEDDLLGLIDRYFPREHRNVALERGDDCAEIRCPETMAVSTDLFLEDAHFRRSYFTPEEIGHKALAVNLSDLAGAGAVPLGFSVGLIAPAPFSAAMAEGVIKGMAKLAAAHAIPLTGGDISRGEKLGFCITIWGGPATPEAPFLRRGSVKPGYRIFLLGEPGLARAGLIMLESEGRAALPYYPACCQAHLQPDPLVTEGLLLAKATVSAPGCRLMDISDGLARDLPRLLGDFGADITLEANSLHHELLAFLRERGGAAADDPAAFAFMGGEEYGLLGACPEEAFPALRAACDGSRRLLDLGVVRETPGIRLNGRDFSLSGFDHFAPSTN
ncbi:thiamine-phosphate kinase [Desulfovibrio sp. OttesenSCG-928-I05]|nr:thiamine-phosphate kinase [Desulfovibrio sp. OttesenSCG-928-I05]